jgi:acyl carrier protein
MQTDQKATTELSDARRALLQRYLRGGLTDTRPSLIIPKRSTTGPIPLSYSQQQIWVHSQLAEEMAIYNEPITIHFSGPLDVTALEHSFTEIVRRHEAWRTTFLWEGDHGIQNVQAPPEQIAIPRVDLRNIPQNERDQEALNMAKRDVLQPFDLAHGPMYRLQLVQMNDSEHRLYLTLHHIIFDGFSLYRVLLPELQTLYRAFANRSSALLPDLAIQYPDYSNWQRSTIKGISPEQLSYWKTVCEELPVIDLPTDRSRPAVQTYSGATESLQISPATTFALKALSDAQGTTPFMTMVAALMTLLHSYTGREDIVVGGVSNGRQHTETMGLLGCFLNTVPIRCAFSKDLSFTDLLSRIRKATLDALSYEVPFELLVQRFAQGRDPSRAPLVQVLIVVEPPLDGLQREWGFSYMDVDTGVTKFDLELALDDRPEGLAGRFNYNTDLFQKETIALLKSRWLQLLDRIVANPEQRLSDLAQAVLSTHTQDVDLPRDEWNATVHKPLEEQAQTSHGREAPHDPTATKPIRDFVTPKTPLEERLAAIWADVLATQRVGANDNFFDLGGHSLSGLRLVNRLREMLGKHIPLAIVFEAPTVAEMANHLQRNYNVAENRAASEESGTFAPVVPINRESRRARRP